MKNAPSSLADAFGDMQDLIRRYDGVILTRVGYSGGDVPNATYRHHGTHAEAIEIVFDPARISYRKLLEFFFQIHDLTTPNRQGNDRGLSYRSAMIYAVACRRRLISTPGRPALSVAAAAAGKMRR